MESDLKPPKRSPKRRIGPVVALGLFVVAAIVALLVAAIRKKNKDTMFALYADMHNLMVTQTAYYTDHAAYATDLSDRYRPTRGSTVRIDSASDTSWSATLTHPRTAKVCTIRQSQPRGATKNQMAAARNAAMMEYVCK